LKPIKNVAVGDIVLVMDQPRSSWTMARVQKVIVDKKGLVRSVEVKTPTVVLQMPIHKLSLIR
jgi:hypothetical protein